MPKLNKRLAQCVPVVSSKTRLAKDHVLNVLRERSLGRKVPKISTTVYLFVATELIHPPV